MSHIATFIDIVIDSRTQPLTLYIPSVHVSPLHPTVQLHSSGIVQVPPLSQSGVHTAKCSTHYIYNVPMYVVVILPCAHVSPLHPAGQLHSLGAEQVPLFSHSIMSHIADVAYKLMMLANMFPYPLHMCMFPIHPVVQLQYPGSVHVPPIPHVGLQTAVPSTSSLYIAK